jgi:hypothetical protein
VKQTFERAGRLNWLAAILACCLLLAISPIADAHGKKRPKGSSKAAKELKMAGESLERYKAGLAKAGNYNCCIKPPAGSKVAGCNMCASANGSCMCGANLAQGRGVCGECKGGWESGRGAMSLKDLKIAGIEAIPILPSEKQAAEGVIQDPNNPDLKAFREMITAGKKILVQEKRFNCCVGNGGCNECAMEQYCGCGPAMAADMEKKAGEEKEGICGQCMDGQHSGHGRVQGGHPNHTKIAPMDMDMSMEGSLGNWPMSREGSGTSWLPDASPMFMKSLPSSAPWSLNLMGSASVNYTDAGGKRGESQLYSNSMAMLMGHRTYGDGSKLGFHVMGSLDPVFNGKRGVPNLFQTGETANGEPLKDRQHPHDLIAEVAATYSRPIGRDSRAFVYLAPVGEPALGGPMFLHRPSGMEIPEAPISHHWFDSSHITFGVGTLGATFSDKWKVEGSVFNGREPDEERFDIDPIRFNSYSGRLTHNPNPNWSLSVAYGFLKEPEVLEPGVDQHRLTASAIYSRPVGNGDNLSLALLYGRNIKSGDGEASNAWALEGTYYRGPDSWFARLERVDKDELVDVPEGTYTINKLVFGGVRNIAQRDGFDVGVGAYVGLYGFPSSLNQFYGKNPVSFGVFLRVRPGKH